jgi:hypothetical protein
VAWELNVMEGRRRSFTTAGRIARLSTDVLESGFSERALIGPAGP